MAISLTTFQMAKAKGRRPEFTDFVESMEFVEGGDWGLEAAGCLPSVDG
jgi:hypothetical protein